MIGFEDDNIKSGSATDTREYNDSNLPFHLIDKEDKLVTRESSYVEPSELDLLTLRNKIGPINYFNYFFTPRILTQKIIAKIARIFFRVGWKVEIKGLENIPEKTPTILMPNHVSHLDAPMVGAFAVKKLKNHAVTGIGDEKLWYNRPFRKFAELINGFPVRKNTKSTEIVEYAIKRVENGSSMFWFPEGQRHKNPSENKTYPGKIGSGMLAHAVNVPIIPVFIGGTEFAMPLGKPLSLGKGPRSINILVNYGKPVPLDDLRALPRSKETSAKVISRIMDHIELLRPEGAYRNQRNR